MAKGKTKEQSSSNDNQTWRRMVEALTRARCRELWFVSQPTGKTCTFDLSCWQTRADIIIFQIWRDHNGFCTYGESQHPMNMDAMIEYCTVGVYERGSAENLKRVRLCVLADGETFGSVEGASILDCPDTPEVRELIEQDGLNELRKRSDVEKFPLA